MEENEKQGGNIGEHALDGYLEVEKEQRKKRDSHTTTQCSLRSKHCQTRSQIFFFTFVY